MHDFIKRFVRSKILRIAFAFFSIALIGGALFIQSDAFMNWVKQRVESEIRNRIADTYTVTIGKITGNVLTGVKVDNVAVFPTGGTPSDEAVLSIRQLTLKYNLFAMLFRKIEVTALEMSQPRLQAEVDAGGNLNLTELFRLSEESQGTAPRATDKEASRQGGFSHWTFAVQRVRCSEGTLRFLDRRRNLDIAITGVTLSFQGPLNTWNHQGTFSISDGSVAFNDAETAITRFDADFLIVASGGELTQFRLNVGNHSVLEATGRYDGMWRADINVQVDAADVQKFARDMPHINGTASLHVAAEGTSDTASGTLTATVPSLTIAGLSGHFTATGGTLSLRDVAIDADFNTHPVPTFSLNRLQMHVAEGLFQASARVKTDIYEGVWQAAGVQLAAIPPMNPFRNWEGSLSTTGAFSGKSTDIISTLRLESTLELTETLLNGIAVGDTRIACAVAASPVGEVANRVYGRSRELNLVGTLADADVQLGGFLGEDLHLHATSLRMDKLMEIFGGGPLNGLGELTADISPVGTMEGHVKIPEATFMDIPLGVLAGDFRYQDEQVFVENGLLTKGESRVSIEGTVGIQGELPATFRILANPCQLSVYRQLLFGNAEYDISGLVTGELLCYGSLSRLDGSGTFAVTEGIAWGMRLDELTLPLAMEDYAITIPNFQISARGQQVTLNLELATTGDFTLDIQNHAPVQLAELVRAADVLDFPIDANMDIVAIGKQDTAQVEEPRGTGPHPAVQKFTFDVDITLADITYEGNPLTDATLHGTLVERKKTTGEPDIFQFVGEAFEGASQIIGEISTATDSPYRFTVQSLAMPATPILRCLHPMLEVVTGTADSTVEITGTLAALSPKATPLLPGNEKPVYPYDVDIVIDTTALRYRDIPITNSEPIRLHLKDDVWTFVDFVLATEAETASPFAALTGTFSARDEAMDIVAKSAGFALQPLGTAFGLALDGTARYEMFINGTVTAPELALELILPALRMQTEFGDILVSTADTGARVRYENNSVQLEPFALQVHGNTIDVAGNIAFTPEDRNASRLNIHLRAQKLAVANYEPLIQKSLPPETGTLLIGKNSGRGTEELISGTLDVSADVTGSLVEPIITVQAKSTENPARNSGNLGNPANPAHIRIGAFPKPIILDALQASVTLNQETVRISDVNVNWRIADATYHAHGNANVPIRRELPFSKPRFAFILAANQLEVSDFASLFLKQAEPSLHGTLSATVELTGSGISPTQISATCEVTSLSVNAGPLYFATNPDTALTVVSRYGTLEGEIALDVKSVGEARGTGHRATVKGDRFRGSVNVAIGGTHIAPEIVATGNGALYHLKWLGAVDYRDEQITVHRVELTLPEKKKLTLTGGIPFDLALAAVPLTERFLDKPMEVHFRGHELPLAFFPKVDSIFDGLDSPRDTEVQSLSHRPKNGVIDNVNDGTTESNAKAPTIVIERLANDRNIERLANDRNLESQAVVDINIGIVGTTRSPQLSGGVSVLAPHLRLKNFPEPIRNATLHLTASEGRIESHNFRFEVGDGACIGQRAHVTLDGLTPKAFTLTGLHLHQFPLAGLARQAVPSEVLGAVHGHVTATLSELQIPLASFFTEAAPGGIFPKFNQVPSLTALAEVATASAELEDVHFGFNAATADSGGSGEPIRYDLRNTEPVPIVIEGGSARLLKDFLMKDFSYRREASSHGDAAAEQPLFRIKGDFVAQLNDEKLPPELQTRLQERAPIESYILTKREDLWRISGGDTNAPEFWLWQRVKAEEQSNGRIQIFEESPLLGIDREASFGFKADFSPQLNASTVPAELRGHLQSKGLILPETLRVSKVNTLWQVHDEETMRRWTLSQEGAGTEKPVLSVFEHSLQVSLDKGSTLQMAACDITARVKNFDVAPLTAAWPEAYRVKGTLSASLQIDNVQRINSFERKNGVIDNVNDGTMESNAKAPTTLIERLANDRNNKTPRITLRRKKPRNRTHLDGIHLNGVPIELNGRLRYTDGAWEITENRTLLLAIEPENTIAVFFVCKAEQDGQDGQDVQDKRRFALHESPSGSRKPLLLIHPANPGHPAQFWKQVFEAPAHLLTGKLTGGVDIQVKDLKTLQFLMPTVNDAGGACEGTVHLNGTLDTPQIDGTVMFKNLALEQEEAGIACHSVDGAFQFSNAHLAITRLGGIVNGGDFSVTGDVFLWATAERIWNPIEPTLALEATLANATFTQEGQYQIEVDSATLGFDGPVASPLLTGAVNIRTGEYRQNWENVREWFAGTAVTATEVALDASPLRELQLDVQLNVPSFYLLSSVTGPTDIHIACDGTLTGLVQQPIFKGDVRILDGRVSFLTQQFEIVEGSRISNDSTTVFDPGLDIRLRPVNPLRAVPLRDGNTADLDVLLTYQGKLSDAEFNLRAEPVNATTTELPTQEEIWALLSQRLTLPFGGVTFGFEPYSRHFSVEYLLPRNMSLKFERDRHEGYGVDFQFEGRF